MLEALRGSLAPSARAFVEERAPLASLPVCQVELQLDPDGSKLSGHERLTFASPGASPLGDVVLRMAAGAGEKAASLRLADVKAGGRPARAERLRAGTWRVALEPPVAPGERVELDLTFFADVPSLPPGADDPTTQALAALGALGGAVAAGVDDHAQFDSTAEGAMLLAEAFPMLAPWRDGAWDAAAAAPSGDAGDGAPANVLLSVVAPRGFAAVAPGALLGAVPEPDGRTRATFAAAAVRGGGVVLAKDLRRTVKPVGDVEVEVYAAPGSEADAAKSLALAADVLARFTRRFGPYPWRQLRVVDVALAGGAGGLELPGVVVLAASLSRAASGQPAPLAGTEVLDGLREHALAHELAHEWWGLVVGSNPRRDPAVAEPLAQYAALLFEEAAHGAKRAKQAADGQVALGYQLFRAGGGADGPAARPADKFKDELEYAALVGGKAPLFYRAARTLLGDKDFTRALQSYYRAYAFREAGPQSFVEEAAKVAPAKAARLRSLWTRWMREAHGDEDLGSLDVASLLGAITGQPVDDQTRALMKSMAPMLDQLMKGQGLDLGDLEPDAGSPP